MTGICKFEEKINFDSKIRILEIFVFPLTLSLLVGDAATAALSKMIFM